MKTTVFVIKLDCYCISNLCIVYLLLVITDFVVVVSELNMLISLEIMLLSV